MVPPSQGRVYRRKLQEMEEQQSSALTRAGISRKPGGGFRLQWFRPHKGGYIARIFGLYGEDGVPPSQGRVYRVQTIYAGAVWCSALTRAGISPGTAFSSQFRKFRPHKGGYIATSDRFTSWTIVPPSQGRVYRQS